MKSFSKFTYFFTLILTSAIASIFFLNFLINVFDYIKADSELESATLSLMLGKNLLITLIVIVVGFSLTSIVYLLFNIAFKKQKECKQSINIEE